MAMRDNVNAKRYQVTATDANGQIHVFYLNGETTTGMEIWHHGRKYIVVKCCTSVA